MRISSFIFQCDESQSNRSASRQEVRTGALLTAATQEEADSMAFALAVPENGAHTQIFDRESCSRYPPRLAPRARIRNLGLDMRWRFRRNATAEMLLLWI